MNWQRKLTLGVGALVLSAQALAQITFYEGEGFRGRAFTTESRVKNFNRFGFNDRASSVVVDSGRWEVCEREKFQGRCMVLRPGSYASLRDLGVNDRLSSVRPVDERHSYRNEAAPPLAAPNYDYRRRPYERVYNAPVTSVHAVVGPPEKRCWVERTEVQQPRRSGSNVGGAIIGGLIGGVIGHQVGGHDRNVATAGGAVVGAVVGANVGRGSGRSEERDVRRCETSASGTPEYWDVTYDYRGEEHRVQMTAPPGRTIAVNQDGVPRQ